MKRNKPHQHYRRLKSGKKVLVNPGVVKKIKRKNYSSFFSFFRKDEPSINEIKARKDAYAQSGNKIGELEMRMREEELERKNYGASPFVKELKDMEIEQAEKNEKKNIKFLKLNKYVESLLDDEKDNEIEKTFKK